MLAAVLLAATPRPATAQHPAGCRPARTALVLGGGGAKGFAHVGVLRALDSAGVRPDLVVGTSIGAITGALYASGYSGRQIDSLTRALSLGSIIHPYEPVMPEVLGELPPVVVWELRRGRMRLQSGAVREAEVNALVSALMLRGNLRARGDFDALPIPFRAVAADLSDRSVVVLGTGDLARAVRASFAIPMIFQPVEVDGRILNDGGIAANVPVQVARDLGAERVIVSMLPSGSVDPGELDDPLSMGLQLSNFLFDGSYPPLGPEDVLIRNPTDSLNPLDFSRPLADRLGESGYRAAQAALARAACLRPLGAAPRAPAREPTRVATIDVAGASPRTRDALAARLGLRASAPLDPDSVQTRILGLGHVGEYTALWLNPTRPPDAAARADSAGADSLVAFAMIARRAPVRALGVGFAYDDDFGGRVWAGLADRERLRGALQVGVDARAGRYRQELGLTARTPTRAEARRLPLLVTARAAHEEVRVWTFGVEQPARAVVEGELFAGASWSPGPARLSVGPVARWWDAAAERPHGAVGVRGVAQVAGGDTATARLEGEINGRFRYARADLSRAFRLGKLELTPFASAAAGDALPLHETFALGGWDGFPGLRIGEWRGERALWAGLGARRRIAGPVALRLTLEGGTAGDRGGWPPPSAHHDAAWLGGARVGLEAPTPLGPVRVEEGVNTAGNDALFVRIGRWF